MKQKKLFVVVLLFSIWLAGCENGLTNPDNQSGPSKTTVIEGEIGLWAKYYTQEQANGLLNWDEDGDGEGGWWEYDPYDNEKLALSNLMPNGEIKNNTAYEVTVSGTTDVSLEHFQFVFTVPGNMSILPWKDLSDYTDDQVPAGKFDITGTLTTLGVLESATDPQGNYHETDVKSLFNKGVLAFTNGVNVPLIEEGKAPVPDELKATLSNVSITITEK